MLRLKTITETEADAVFGVRSRRAGEYDEVYAELTRLIRAGSTDVVVVELSNENVARSFKGAVYNFFERTHPGLHARIRTRKYGDSVSVAIQIRQLGGGEQC